MDALTRHLLRARLHATLSQLLREANPEPVEPYSDGQVRRFANAFLDTLEVAIEGDATDLDDLTVRNCRCVVLPIHPGEEVPVCGSPVPPGRSYGADLGCERPEGHRGLHKGGISYWSWEPRDETPEDVGPPASNRPKWVVLSGTDLFDAFWTMGVAKRALGIQGDNHNPLGMASVWKARELVLNLDEALTGKELDDDEREELLSRPPHISSL